MRSALASTLAGPSRWWLYQLRMSLPQTLQSWNEQRGQARVVIALEHGQVQIRLLDPRNATIVRHCADASSAARSTLDSVMARRNWLAGQRRRALSYEARNAVVGTLKIPSRARAREAEIVADQVARRTPFERDELLVGYRSSPSRGGMSELHYAALPRARIDAAVAPLGLKVDDFDGFDVPADAGVATHFLPVRAASSGSLSAGLRIAVALVAGGVLAGALGTGALAWRQHHALLELEQRISDTVPAVRDRSAELKQIYRLADDVSHARELRAKTGVVEVWESLAKILPDSAYLTDFEVNGNELVASGYAQAAPDLIRRFEESGTVHGAALTGPVLQDPETGKEQFSIRAVLHRPHVPNEDEP
jgi:general secretion pathway protein L